MGHLYRPSASHEGSKQFRRVIEPFGAKTMTGQKHLTLCQPPEIFFWVGDEFKFVTKLRGGSSRWLALAPAWAAQKGDPELSSP